MQIECSLCKQAVEHFEVFFQEESDEWRVHRDEAFICRACQEKRIKDLLEATPEKILELIKLGHPNEHGHPYGRFEVMEEIQRRANEIFDGLKWPKNKESIYKNRYTGHEETLDEMSGDTAYHKAEIFEEWFIGQSWSILEHWLPIDIWTDVDLMDCYKRNPPLTKWFK